MESYAVVLGLGGSNALGVVKSLGYEEIPTVGFHKFGREFNAHNSKYIEEHYIVENESGLLSKLIEFGKQQKSKSVLFPTGDDYISFCSKNKDILKKYFHVPKVPEKNLEKLLDKKENSQLGLNTGFDVPHSTYLSEFSNFDGPVIIKPLNSIVGGKADMKVYISEEQLLKDKNKLLNKFGDMAVQDFIPGDNTNLFEVHAYKSSEGSIISGMQRNKLAIEKGDSAYIGVIFENVWVNELVKPSIKFVGDLNFNGALDINFKRSDYDGKFYFMETNFRTSANLSLDTAAGCNLPAIIYYDLTNQSFNHLLKGMELGKKWIHEGRIERYLKQNSEETLMKELEKGIVTVFYDKTDMQPFYDQNFSQTTKKFVNLINSNNAPTEI